MERFFIKESCEKQGYVFSFVPHVGQCSSNVQVQSHNFLLHSRTSSVPTCLGVLDLGTYAYNNKAKTKKIPTNRDY